MSVKNVFISSSSPTPINPNNRLTEIYQMKVKYRKSRFNYTLLEILSAMAVFMIICLVVVRFFSGAQKLTTSTNSYNEMYADVRAFFDIFGNDLQTMIYDNSVSPKGNQPFVLSYYDINASGPFKKFYGNIQKFYADNMVPPLLMNDMALGKVDYVPLLCLIANPSNIQSDSSSTTAEVRYTFIPVGATSTKPAEFDYSELGSATPSRPVSPAEFKHGGKILRSLTYDDSNKPATPNYNSNRYPLDYDIFPIVDGDGVSPTEAGSSVLQRIKWVFEDKSSCKYDEVIGHVYRMNITCYKLETDSTGKYTYKKYRFFDMVGNEKLAFSGDSTSNYIIWPPDGSIPQNPKITYPSPPAAVNTPVELAQLGHPLPDMVRVDLYMLSPQDWNLLINYYDWTKEEFTDKIAAQRLLKQKLRHFSRVFHININE